MTKCVVSLSARDFVLLTGMEDEVSFNIGALPEDERDWCLVLLYEHPPVFTVLVREGDVFAVGDYDGSDDVIMTSILNLVTTASYYDLDLSVVFQREEMY